MRHVILGVKAICVCLKVVGALYSFSAPSTVGQVERCVI